MPNLNKLIQAGETHCACKKCNRFLPFSCFLKTKEWINYCKDCERQKLKIWRKNNPDKLKLQVKRHTTNQKRRGYKYVWAGRNSEKHKAQQREYYKNHKDKHNASFYKRLKNDPVFRIKHQMRGDLNKRLKKMFGSNNNKPSKMLGCSLPEMKAYLESKFKPGMSWENYGRRGYNSDGTKIICWEVDHIVPMETATTKEEMYALCHYTNLQPLWWWENTDKIKLDRKRRNA